MQKPLENSEKSDVTWFTLLMDCSSSRVENQRRGQGRKPATVVRAGVVRDGDGAGAERGLRLWLPFESRAVYVLTVDAECDRERWLR